jgi:Bacteriophage HK97-gp10, putative tail-component
MKLSHELVGFGQLAEIMKNLVDNLDDKLTPAARASAERLRSRISAAAPRETGRLAGSFRIATRKGEATVYSDVPYAHRIEYGFMGVDELGRSYHVPPNAFVQRAGVGLVDDFIEEITKIFD